MLKYTPDDHSDKTDIPKVVKMIRELLTKVNVESGKSENRFNLAQLDQQLVFRQGEAVVSCLSLHVSHNFGLIAVDIKPHSSYLVRTCHLTYLTRTYDCGKKAEN